MRVLISALLLCCLVASCTSDPCEEINCQQGGYCVGGDCACPEGFGGPECESEICDTLGCANGFCETGTCVCENGWTGRLCDEELSEFYSGNWLVSPKDCDFSSGKHSVTISQTSSPEIILINGLLGCNEDLLVSFADANNLKIEGQAYSCGIPFIAGSANFLPSTATLEFFLQSSSWQGNCVLRAVRN